jgi:hypothetical protein
VYDVAVSPSGTLIAAITSNAPVVSVFANTPPSFPLLATYGTLSTSTVAPGVLNNPRAAVFSTLGSAGAPLLLVADTYNNQLQEVRVVVTATSPTTGVPTSAALVFVRFVLSGAVAGPVALATTSTTSGGVLLAVSEVVTRTVAVFDLATASGSQGPGGGAGSVPTLRWRTSSSIGLSVPLGLRFTRDGAHVAVADYSNHRVVLLALGVGGAYVRDAASSSHGIRLPQDLEECDSGFLVLNTVSPVPGSGTGGVAPLVVVPKDGTPPVAYGGGLTGAVGNATGQVSRRVPTATSSCVNGFKSV